MELLPFGPVVLVDTPGIDDESSLGELRVQKSMEYIDQADLILFVVDGGSEISKEELEFIEKIKEKKHIIVGNKCDSIEDNKKECKADIYVSATQNINIDKLKALMAEILNKGKKEYQTKLSVEVDRISLDTLKNFMNVLATEKIYSLNRSKNGTYIFTVTSQNATNKEAYQNAMSKFNEIQQKLNKAGIPAGIIKIAGYDNKEINLEKRTNNRKNIQIVSHEIEVETRDLKNLGNIINVANTLGIGTTGQIEYDIDNKQQLENELYENAYKEALKKAQVILGKTDLNLKNPVTITDKSYGVIQPYTDYNYSYYSHANYETNLVQLKKSDKELLDESARRNIVISPKKLNILKTVYIEFEMD